MNKAFNNQLSAVVPENRRSFTLIELLVVVAIIAVMVAVLLPTFGMARRQAKLVVCTSNLRQYATGLVNWAMTEDPSDAFPPNPTYLHRVWDHGYAALGYPKGEYLARFVEVVCGGNGMVLWCPFDWRVKPLLENSPYTTQWHGILASGPEQTAFQAGYNRYAHNTLGGISWLQSGNTANDHAPMKPEESGSQDTILSDLISYDTDYYDLHARYSGDARTYQDNNVAYADGHVETHKFGFDTGLPFPHWTGHYVVLSGVQYFLY